MSIFTYRYAEYRKLEPQPWDEEYARKVFDGEISDFPSHADFGVIKSVGGKDVAAATFQTMFNTGIQSVSIVFFDQKRRNAGRYLFVSGPTDLILHPDGIQRDKHLFLKHVDSIVYTGQVDQYGVPVQRERLVRMFNSRGQTLSYPDIEDPSNPYPRTDWHTDPEVDTSGDGFWEPEATFGDWDR